jgi:molybdopterin converting factor small subunit
VKVLIPSLLLSYTGARTVRAEGRTLAEVMLDLDRRFPGLRFRVVDEQDALRPHVRFFINGEQVFDLATAVTDDDELVVVQALSGG